MINYYNENYQNKESSKASSPSRIIKVLESNNYEIKNLYKISSFVDSWKIIPEVLVSVLTIYEIKNTRDTIEITHIKEDLFVFNINISTLTSNKWNFTIDDISSFMTLSDNFPFKFSENKEKIKITGSIFCENPFDFIKDLYNTVKAEFFIKSDKYKDKLNEICLSGIKIMGFKNTKTNKTGKITTYLYAINDNANNCTIEWSTFPILLDISKHIIDLKIIFAINSKPWFFSQEKLKQVKAFIKMVNSVLTFGSFQYDSSKKFIAFRMTQYLLVTPFYNLKLIQKLTSQAVHIYTSYGYGLYQIYSLPESPNPEVIKTKNQELLSICIKRSLRPVAKFYLSPDKVNAYSYKTFYFTNNDTDLETEKKIIELLKKDQDLSAVFLVDSIKMKKNKVKYPFFRIDQQEAIKELKFFDDLNNIIIKLMDFGLKIDKNLIDGGFIYKKNKIIFSYNIALSKILSVLQENEKYQYSLAINEYLISNLKEKINKDLWYSKDILFHNVDLDNLKYLGIKTKIESIIPYEEIEKIKDERLKKLITEQTIGRYRINQQYKSKCVVKYLGLKDMYSNVVENYDGISFDKIREENLYIKLKELAHIIFEFCSLVLELMSKNANVRGLIPTKVILIKNPKNSNSRIKVHLLGNDELYNSFNKELSYIYISPDSENETFCLSDFLYSISRILALVNTKSSWDSNYYYSILEHVINLLMKPKTLKSPIKKILEYLRKQTF